MGAPDDHFLSILVLVLELFEALLRQAVATGLAVHDQLVYLYNPSQNCTINDEPLKNQRAPEELCNRGAGIGLLVVFSILCLMPIPLGLIVVCTHCKGGTETSHKTSHLQMDISKPDHDGQDYSPLITVFYILFSRGCGRKRALKALPNTKTTSKPYLVAYFMKTIAIILYFFGDNLEPILLQYGECVNCRHRCLPIVLTVAKVAVLTSTALFFAIPHIVHYVAKKLKWNYKPADEYEALGIFGHVLKAQSLYSSSITVFRTFDYCSVKEQVLGWIFILIVTAITTATVSDKAISYIDKKKVEPKYKYISGTLVSIFSIVFVLCFLLGDNKQPLDCAFGCDLRGMVNMNEQENALFGNCCKYLSNIITRLALTATCAAIVIGIIFSSCLSYKIWARRKSTTIEPSFAAH